MTEAKRLTVRGTVQGVGFRPFVSRLAATHHLRGWVLNAPDGVDIHVEGETGGLSAFVDALHSEPPAAARVEAVTIVAATPLGLTHFLIRDSERRGALTVRISPDLPVCDDCLAEMGDAGAARYQYPYINCTNCGPRYSVITGLPYDRERTTMAPWPLCQACDAEYRTEADRRFHAEPTACPSCGPRYRLVGSAGTLSEGREAIQQAARMLCDGSLVAIKGVGGYHLCCDAMNASAVAALRNRKYRKSRPFAVMAKNLGVVWSLVHIDLDAESLLTCPARPIVLMRARVPLREVAPHGRDLGVMVPYAPIHHLLFHAGAPAVLVMTSGNRSSEPIAYEDEDALQRLGGIADAFLIGERPIARRVDDSVVRPGVAGPMILRRARGYAPAPAAKFPASRPILALGADLKNSITLVIDGEAIVSQHIGDLVHLSAARAFRETIRDLLAMYGVNARDVIVAHDAHPEYTSTACAQTMRARQCVPVQHHRAHIASVLAERQSLDKNVVGLAFDGTGYGDDGSMWGGEFFVGSVSAGLTRAASLRPFILPGGDAAARWPTQAAAGALHALDDLPDLTAAPFCFSRRFVYARQLAASGVRSFSCTSAGRLFDAAAALLGFTAENEYEGQAAEWLEQLAWQSPTGEALPYRLTDRHVDFGDALRALMQRRLDGDDVSRLARAWHETFVAGLTAVATRLCREHGITTVVASGGTFQNALVVERLRDCLPAGVTLWMNERVPPNDGGISLGQAAVVSVTVQG